MGLPRFLAALGFLAALAGAARADFVPPSATQPDPKIEARVETLLGQLTLEEKIGLLSGTDYMHTAAVPRLGIPALKFSDGPLGVRCWGQSTAYPAGALLAATWDPDLARAEGVALGRDARARGVHVVLGPAMNIYREAQDSRNFEYFGEDPVLASALAVNYVQGLQSQGVAACIKHYVANGQEWHRNDVDTIVSRRALEEIYFPPFQAAIQEGNAWTAMAAYNKVNGEWCTANHFLLTDVLRHDWGFLGLMMSDWGAVHDTRKDLNAGLDLEMGTPRGYYNERTITPLLQSGAVSAATLDEHVRRMLRLIVAMGFMDRDQTDRSIPLDDPQSADTALKIASEGIVLLKNEGGFLPLDRAAVHHILVTGPNGQEAVIGGGGSSGTTPFEKVSVLEGVQQAAGPGVRVDYLADWNRSGWSDDDKKRVAAADVIVYAGGLNPASEHEGRDRDWDLPAPQMDELRQLLALNPHVIAAINAGGNLGLGDNLAKIPALLWAWYPGQNGNLALGKILFGDLNPSGHLPDTFEQRLEDSPAFGNYPGDITGGPHVNLAEGIYVGYRWYDKKKITPAFPFGFGLSYTTFAIRNARSSPDADGFDVTVDVTNTGPRDGAEVMQLYVRPVGSTIDRPVQELKAFQRVELKAGETKTVTLTLQHHDFATYDETSSRWIVPPGAYQLAVGDSSRDIAQTTSVTLSPAK
jgi:beta-glucosidase